MRMGNKHPPQIHQPLSSPDAMIERLRGSHQWRNNNAQSYIRADFTSDCKRLRGHGAAGLPQIYHPLMSPDAMFERWHGSREEWQK